MTKYQFIILEIVRFVSRDRR